MVSIIVVDDDPDVLDGMEAVLKRAGHQVRTAYDGRQALYLLKQAEADLAICDIMMPEVDGFEFFRTLKKDHPSVRFFAISGHTYSSKMNLLGMAEAMGAEKVFAKPVTSKDLLSAIDSL